MGQKDASRRRPDDGKSSNGSHLKWLSEIIVGVISGLIVAFAFTSTGHATGVYGADFFSRSKPTCENPQWLLRVPADQIFANSYYTALDTMPHSGILHSADLSIDNNPRTAWLQWWPINKSNNNGNADNNNIAWKFTLPYDIRLICIINGWTRDSVTYGSTLPIGDAIIFQPSKKSAATVTKACGNEPIKVHFQDYINQGDSYDWKAVTMNCRTRRLALRIEDVSNASVRMRKNQLDMSPDPAQANISEPLVGLSEVEFYYAPSYLSYVP